MNIQLLTPNFSQPRNVTTLHRNDAGKYYYPNLRPLTSDVVSFGAAARAAKNIAENQKVKNATAKVLGQWDSDAVNFDEVIKVAENYEEPLKKFLVALRTEMKGLIASDVHPQNPILPGNAGIKGRVKTPRSIAQKANSRKLFSQKEMETMGDVGGARIVLRSFSQEDVGKIFDALGNMVKKGFKFTEVENYRVDPQNSYVSQKTLDKFEALCHKHKQYPRITSKGLPSAYTAVHVGVELPKGKIIELQIMGKDVEQAKEIEDFFYKWRCKKDFDPKYKPIQHLFKKLLPRLDDFQQETLDRYISDSYLHAFKLPEKSARSKLNVEKDYFLPFPYSLPQELSYVNLHKMIEECNKKARLQ